MRVGRRHAQRKLITKPGCYDTRALKFARILMQNIAVIFQRASMLSRTTTLNFRFILTLGALPRPRNNVNVIRGSRSVLVRTRYKSTAYPEFQGSLLGARGVLKSDQQAGGKEDGTRTNIISGFVVSSRTAVDLLSMRFDPY